MCLSFAVHWNGLWSIAADEVRKAKGSAPQHRRTMTRNAYDTYIHLSHVIMDLKVSNE